MKQLLTCILLILSSFVSAQQEFFKSDQKFSTENLEKFYSSVTIHDSIILFKANDYSLYAYNKHTGKQIWKYYLRYKSNSHPHVAGGYIWTNDAEEDGLRLDITGSNPKKLPFSIYSKPLIKNNLLYTTGLYEAGNLLAYDMAADSIAWYHFIAHGCDRQPFYLQDRIIANAEGSNWFEIDYNGALLNKDCELDENEYPSGENCYDPFIIRTHDGNRMYEKQGEKFLLGEYSDPEVSYTANKTFILHEGRFSIVGKKMKKLFSKELIELSDSIEEDNYEFSSILKTDDKHAWILYNQKLLVFDHHKNKIENLIDLAAWEPHSAEMDGNNLWLISKKDGLLYGIKL